MKAKLIVDIKYIKRQKVDETLLKKIPQLNDSVERTIKILCKQIDKYFKEYKIVTTTKLESLK